MPGWYGIAWVKWLQRIELHDRKFLGRFMGRDYVTIRGEKRGEDVIWRETSVGKMNLKSVVARAIKARRGHCTSAAPPGATALRSGPWKSKSTRSLDGPPD